MPMYGPANGEVTRIISSLIDDFYPEFVETKAEIGAVFAYPIPRKNGPPSPPVTVYGMPAIAKAKVNGESDRIEGKPDGTITIDHQQWRDMDAPEREALIDRMLYSFRIRKKKGEILTDDRGRPLLRLAKPDWCLSGFRAMAERHKEHSIEVIQARQLQETYGQLLFGFAAEAHAELPGVEAGPKRPRKRGAAVVAASHR